MADVVVLCGVWMPLGTPSMRDWTDRGLCRREVVLRVRGSLVMRDLGESRMPTMGEDDEGGRRQEGRGFR